MQSILSSFQNSRAALALMLAQTANPATAQINNPAYADYLQEFAIPFHPLIAWVVTLGELYVAAGLLLGLTTRLAACVSCFILFNFAIGSYYDASLLPFFILNTLFLLQPSGL